MMELLADIRWREPLWLALLLVPLLVRAWRRADPRATRRLQRFADAHLWRRLLRGGTSGVAPGWLFGTAWGLATIAAAGPYLTTGAPSTDMRRGVDIAVILDISPSMQVADVAPNRLARARLELTDFVARLRDDRIALIAFSSHAYRLLPLTHDHAVFREYLDYLTPGLVFRQGSNLTRALEQAEDWLRRAAQPARAIVLLTDGEAHYPGANDVARRLGAAGIPVLAIGLGTDQGGPVPAAKGGYVAVDGETVVSRLARGALQDIAAASGGVYTDVRDDDRDWDALFARLDAIADANRYPGGAPLPGQALFPWLITAALTLFLIAGIRRPEGLAIVLLAVTYIAPPAAHAWVWQEQQAWDALNGGDCDRAMTLYQRLDTYAGRFGAGAAAYRCERWDDAIAAFRRAGELAPTNEERARAAYNRGNSHARRGDVDAAIRAFEEALALRPAYQPAARNLTLLNRQRAAPRLGGDTPADEAAPRADVNAGMDDDRPPAPAPGDVRGTVAPRSGAAAESRRDTTAKRPAMNGPARAAERETAGIGAALQQLERLEDDKLEFLRNRMITEETRFGKQLEDKPW